MLEPWYDIHKAAQAAAFFTLKAGGRISVVSLTKLLYDAERASMDAYDEPMFYDDLKSLPKGPIVSIALDFINGQNKHPVWSRFVGCRELHDVAVADGISSSDFDHLSKADLEILEAVWEMHKDKTPFELVAFMHNPKNRPEWTDPQGSSLSISHEDVYRHLGKVNSEELAKEVEAYKIFKQKSARA